MHTIYEYVFLSLLCLLYALKRASCYVHFISIFFVIQLKWIRSRKQSIFLCSKKFSQRICLRPDSFLFFFYEKLNPVHFSILHQQFFFFVCVKGKFSVKQRRIQLVWKESLIVAFATVKDSSEFYEISKIFGNTLAREDLFFLLSL